MTMKITRALATKIESTPATKRRVPFKTFGCVLHRIHKPTPNRVELHHRFALYLQARVWPDVDPTRPQTARDTERIPVCEGGHTDVHVAINAILAGAPMPKGVGRAERLEAQETIARYNAAVL
jgi:hypothetical protein